MFSPLSVVIEMRVVGTESSLEVSGPSSGEASRDPGVRVGRSRLPTTYLRDREFSTSLDRRISFPYRVTGGTSGTVTGPLLP